MIISQATREFILRHRNDNPTTLALSAKSNPEVDMAFAVTQIAGRQIAAQKVPTWAAADDIVYPRHLSMEQCSSEATALYKASLVSGESMADLTGGLGVDCHFMAQRFGRATYIERQEELCRIAENNFRVLGDSHIDVRHGESTEQLRELQPVDWIFIDPARRDEHGGKTVQIADCEPDVAQLEETLLAKASHVMVKLSPMLDATLALHTLKHVTELHIVSVANECKELLLLLERNAQTAPEEVKMHCVNITPHATSRFCFTRREEQEAAYEHSDRAERYLYEPNASVMKGGAFRSVAAAFGVKKLHPNSHLYTSEELRKDFPGRVFHVEAGCSLNKKELKSCLGDLKKANISVRNFPATVAELRKRTKLTEGGDIYLFATTLNNGNKVMLKCTKVQQL
jgi:16S rRNA G966 N2-methylase RsmD